MASEREINHNLYIVNNNNDDDDCDLVRKRSIYVICAALMSVESFMYLFISDFSA